MLGAMMLNRIKKGADAQDGVTRLMALGLSRDSAKLLAARLATACRLSGCTAQEKETVNILAAQIIAKGFADEAEIKTLAEVCPYLVHQLMKHYGFHHRSLFRYAADGKFTAEKFINAVMHRIEKDAL